MDKTKLAKEAAGFVIGGCTAKIIKDLIKNNVTPDSVTDKVALIVATFALGAMAREATKEWTDAQIDKIIAQWQEAKAKEIIHTV